MTRIAPRMAATVSWDALRDLAGFRAAKGVAVSFYLDLDPAAGDDATRVNSLLAEAGKHVDRADLNHDQRKSLKADIERIRQYVEQELVRDGAHGLALFADELDNLWRPLTLTESVADTVKISAELYLTPLVPLVGRGEGALVAVVGRERGELFRLRGGRLEPISSLTEDQPGRHDQGGWSQANYERHIEHLVQDHLKRVATELDRRVRGRSERVVVVTTEETKAAFDDLLPKAMRSTIVGWTTAEAHAGPAELLAVATPVLEAWRAREEEQAVERWREEAGRNGRAAAGWQTTLEAASDGRVDLLLYRNGIHHVAYRCPSCGRLAVEDGTCPLDGTHLEQTDEGLDLAVHHTLSNGGTVWAVTTRGDLDPVEGIGALLRY
jgi:peptide chain release factor subunit 1